MVNRSINVYIHISYYYYKNLVFDEKLKPSRTWNIDVLIKLLLEYSNEIDINETNLT